MAEKKLIAVNDSNLKEFEHLHNCIFLTKFSRQFYREAVDKKKPGIHYIAVYEGKNVGVLSACVNQESTGELELYIYSLGCKFLHRRKGVGSHLLDKCVEFAINQNCRQIKLHVKENNEDAIRFYQNHGFHQFAEAPNYYKRPTLSNALILCKSL